VSNLFSDEVAKLVGEQVEAQLRAPLPHLQQGTFGRTAETTVPGTVERERASAADLAAVHRLIGCRRPESPDERDINPCPWEGVVEIQFGNSQGPKWNVCREHGAPYRPPIGGARQADGIDPNEWAVRDSGRPNRRLIK